MFKPCINQTHLINATYFEQSDFDTDLLQFVFSRNAFSYLFQSFMKKKEHAETFDSCQSIWLPIVALCYTGVAQIEN